MGLVPLRVYEFLHLQDNCPTLLQTSDIFARSIEAAVHLDRADKTFPQPCGIDETVSY